MNVFDEEFIYNIIDDRDDLIRRSKKELLIYIAKIEFDSFSFLSIIKDISNDVVRMNEMNLNIDKRTMSKIVESAINKNKIL